MKSIYKKLLFVVLGLILLWIFAVPFYLKESLIHWYPNLDDYKISANNDVANAQPIPWELADNYNQQELTKADLEYLEAHETTAYLVIQNGKIIYEKYWQDCADSTASNLFSVTKSIVSLLVGIAIDEGKIPSMQEKISNYIPEFTNDKRGDITIRNLLTMSSGLDWDEQYTSPFSVTTQAYYGNNLRKLVTQQKLIATPGKQFNYLSADTQLLAFIVEKATGMTISKYAQEKLWKRIGAEHKAIWSKDAENGDERAFCCFYTNAKDIARIGQLILNKGKWNGVQIVSENYINEATRAAKDLKDEFDNFPLNYYGYQWWILHQKDQVIPYMRGYRGQYIYSILDKNAVVVRLGKQLDKKEVREITEDIKKYVEMAQPLLK